MSWQRVGVAVGAVVLSGLSAVGGKFWGQHLARKAHKHLHEENEKLRAEREALTSFFEHRGYNYETIIAQIFAQRPANEAQLRELLAQFSLSEKEIERISEKLAELHFYDQKAA